MNKIHRRNINREEIQSLPLVQKYWFWGSIFIYVALQVFFTIRMSAFGAKLQSLEIKTVEISERNKKLHEELVNSTSLTKLEEKGNQIGFIKPQKMLYLGGEEFVAKAQ